MRLIIFDADGTLRRPTVPDRPAPYAPGEWALQPGVREKLARMSWAPDGPHLGIASNQDRVGWGQVPEAVARRLLYDLVEAATAGRVRDARIELCPHIADAGCDCRKPRPGMLRAIMRHFGVRPEDTLFVGDTPADREAAVAAGTSFAWAWDFFGWPLPDWCERPW